MSKQGFVDYENLKLYDENLKQYIENKIQEAIDQYRAEDIADDPDTNFVVDDDE